MILYEGRSSVSSELGTSTHSWFASNIEDKMLSVHHKNSDYFGFGLSFQTFFTNCTHCAHVVNKEFSSHVHYLSRQSVLTVPIQSIYNSAHSVLIIVLYNHICLSWNKKLLSLFSGGSRISPRWGRQPSGGPPTYSFATFFQQLHEIERIWTVGGGVQNFNT